MEALAQWRHPHFKFNESAIMARPDRPVGLAQARYDRSPDFDRRLR
jgi:hypothetical protein